MCLKLRRIEYVKAANSNFFAFKKKNDNKNKHCSIILYWKWMSELYIDYYYLK
jgi:hypothetical protein